jgi:hypothetical protein
MMREIYAFQKPILRTTPRHANKKSSFLAKNTLFIAAKLYNNNDKKMRVLVLTHKQDKGVRGISERKEIMSILGLAAVHFDHSVGPDGMVSAHHALVEVAVSVEVDILHDNLTLVGHKGIDHWLVAFLHLLALTMEDTLGPVPVRMDPIGRSLNHVPDTDTAVSSTARLEEH